MRIAFLGNDDVVGPVAARARRDGRRRRRARPHEPAATGGARLAPHAHGGRGRGRRDGPPAPRGRSSARRRRVRRPRRAGARRDRRGRVRRDPHARRARHPAPRGRERPLLRSLPRWRGAAPVPAGDPRGRRGHRRDGDADGRGARHGTDPRDRGDPDRVPTRMPARSAPASRTSGATLLVETLRGLDDGSIEPRSQDHAAATYAPKLLPDERTIDWSQPADAIVRRVRAFAPEPSAVTTFRGGRLKVLRGRDAARRRVRARQRPEEGRDPRLRRRHAGRARGR